MRPSYTEPMQSIKQKCYFVRSKACLVNKRQNMLHMLSLDANTMLISLNHDFVYENNIYKNTLVGLEFTPGVPVKVKSETH